MTDPQRPPSRRDVRDAARAAARGAGAATLSGRHTALIATAMVLGFLLLATGAVFAGIAVGTPKDAAAVSGSKTPPHRSKPADAVAAVGIPTCSISTLAGAANLVDAYGAVVSATSGAKLYGLNDTATEPAAGGMKVLTAAAAVAKLGPSYRITTQVVEGNQPGSIVLVGAGDPTLSAVAPGQSVYADAPSIATLATSALAAYDAKFPDIPLTQVVLDSSYWDPADDWDPSWPSTDQTQGYLSEVTALQVDGDRADPAAEVSPRGSDPVMTAGQAFVNALGLDGVTLVTGQAEDGAPSLASVQSQPVSTLVKEMLLTNDDTLAEMLARIVSVQEGMHGASATLQGAITTALSGIGVDLTGAKIIDGSGESAGDGIPAVTMARLMAAIGQGRDGLQSVAAGMPVAGQTGDLAGRFTGPNAVAAGKVHAKSGESPAAYTLSGYLTAKDGTPLAFSFAGVGSGITSGAQVSLDTLATGVYNCGKNLSSH